MPPLWKGLPGHRDSSLPEESVQVLLEVVALRTPGERLKGREGLGQCGTKPKHSGVRRRHRQGVWRERSGRHSMAHGRQGTTGIGQR